MTFAEKLTSLRKARGLSQERLAQRLGVSRQAVTKWECGFGEPELENVRALATLFAVSYDELLGGESPAPRQKEYESITEYDVDSSKHFDIHLGGARRVSVRADEGEKLRVRLSSPSISSLQNNCKVKLDDIKGRMDIDLLRQNGMTETEAKSALDIDIIMPQKYLARLELAVHAGEVAFASMDCAWIELDGRIAELRVENVRARLEIQCNLDMQIALADFSGSFELNQLFATSCLSVPGDFCFRERCRGIANSITYHSGGKPCEPFAIPTAENIVELNGMKSELVIRAEGGGVPLSTAPKQTV